MSKKEISELRAYLAETMSNILDGCSDEEAREIRERWSLFGFDEDLFM